MSWFDFSSEDWLCRKLLQKTDRLYFFFCSRELRCYFCQERMLLTLTDNVVQIISEPWPRQYLAASQMSSTKSSVIVGVVTSTGFHFRR